MTVPLPRFTPGGIIPAVEEPTEPDIFARQRSIPLEIPGHVMLVGCGGVGAWIGYFLALAGVPKLTIFDSDVVSESNLNRLPYGPAFLKKPKTEALAALIASLRPKCKVECCPNFSAKFANSLFVDEEARPEWVVASTDTWASRREAYKWTDLRCRYVEAAAEGEFGSMAAAPAEWATIEEDNPGYASVPVWIGPSVSAAVMVCSHILHGELRRDASARFGWLSNEDDARIAFSYRNEE
jgi:hypothetical protein